MKNLVVDLSLAEQILQVVLKKVKGPVQKWELAEDIRSEYPISITRACAWFYNIKACFKMSCYQRQTGPENINIKNCPNQSWLWHRSSLDFVAGNITRSILTLFTEAFKTAEICPYKPPIGRQYLQFT